MINEHPLESNVNVTDSWGGRARRWCGTINGPTALDFEQVHSVPDAKIRYSAYGVEYAPSTGKEHLQLMWSFKHPQTFAAVKKLFPRAALFVCKGSEWENYRYCTKTRDCDESPNAIFWEKGIRPIPSPTGEGSARGQNGMLSSTDYVTLLTFINSHK